MERKNGLLPGLIIGFSCGAAFAGAAAVASTQNENAITAEDVKRIVSSNCVANTERASSTKPANSTSTLVIGQAGSKTPFLAIECN